MFGGYTTKQWKDDNSCEVDPQAFLFCLRKKNVKNYVKYYATDKTAIISGYNNCWGPVFGSSDGKQFGLRFFDKKHASLVKRASNTFHCVDLSVNLQHGFNNKGHKDSELHGGNNQLHNIEVYDMSGNRNHLVWSFIFTADFFRSNIAHMHEVHHPGILPVSFG